jgi:hypothetical protein
MAGHEAAFLRRKLEEQQESAELQRAIELQNRRFMGMQLLDLKSRGHHILGSPVGSPGDGNGGCFSANGNGMHHFENNIQGRVLGTLLQMRCVHQSSFIIMTSMFADNSTGLVMGTSAAASAIGKDGRQEQQYEEEEGGGDGNGGSPKQAVNSGEEGRRESGPGAAAATNVVCGYQER